MRATLHAIKAKLRQRLHEPVNAVGAWLKRVVSGYYRYHAVPENQRALWRFRDRLCDLWRSMLGRRSQRSRPSWTRIRPASDTLGDGYRRRQNENWIHLQELRLSDRFIFSSFLL
jgi:RNA-directed DNA polymerase